MVTLQDIAEAAGVSLMTASRCLRNDPRHSEATRKRVRETAERLGYVPNPLVSTLMAQIRQRQARADGSVLGMVGFYPRTTLRDSVAWRRLEKGVRGRAAQLGFGSDWFAMEDYPGERGVARLRKVLLSRRISGLVVFPMPTPHYPLPFDPTGFAIAAIGYSLATPKIHHIGHHNYLALHEAVERMHARGYRRMALALPQVVNANVEQQWLAALAIHPSRAGQHPDDFAFFCTWEKTTHAAERKRFLAWVRATEPDLIFGLYPFADWWREDLRDRKTPVDFASLDLAPTVRDLAGIDQMSENIGASAVDMVVAQLHRNETGVPPYQKLLHAESMWREGPSVRRPAPI
jgi:DNA-binding LacI/PurR family transcriptional regulator